MTPIRLTIAAVVVGLLALDLAHQGSRIYRHRAERVDLGEEIDLLRRERDALRAATQQRLLDPFLEREWEREAGRDLVRLAPPRQENPWSTVEAARGMPRHAFASGAPEPDPPRPLEEWLRDR